MSGYFDGDGTVALTLTMFTVVPSFDWADSYRPQLEAVRDFLTGEGLRPTSSYPCGGSKPVWHLRLYEKGGLMVAAERMLPYLVKKRGQVDAIIDYARNKISGEALVEIFNQATRVGTRSGIIREVSMPYTHSQGVSHARAIVAEGKHASKILTKDVLEEIRNRRNRGESLREISFAYGVSRSSIRRATIKDEKKAP